MIAEGDEQKAGIFTCIDGCGCDIIKPTSFSVFEINLASISDNLGRVRENIDRACQVNGRSLDEVSLICVSKMITWDRVVQAIEAGVTDLGENYVQEAEEKIGKISAAVRWHLIGHLQRNKAAKAAGLFNMVQSVDSARLAGRLSECAVDAGRTLDILLEVNVGGEISKTGLGAEEFEETVELTQGLPGLRLVGVMGIPPPSEDEKTQRQYFGEIRAHWEKLPEENRRVLSMGMSGDFEIAIAEGSTMVRIGTAIFGRRA